MDDKYSSSNSPQNITTNYAYSGKLMLISVITLFVFCFIFVAFLFYSRSFIMRRSANLRRQHQRRRRHSFSSFPSSTAANSPGLPSSALKSLPTFLFSVATAGEEPPLECAVCLSEFSDNEMGRVLPKCDHAFHVECIDMWLVTHSSCPLCRAPIFLITSDPGPRVDPVGTVVPVFEPGNAIGVSSSSSSPSLPQLLTVNVEIPGVTEGSGIGTTRKHGPKTMGGPCPGPSPVRSLKRFQSI